MRLWSIQPKSLYEKLNADGIVCCDSSLSENLEFEEFRSAYDWLSDQMCQIIGSPPQGIKYPIWAWHTHGWKHKKPDLRLSEFKRYHEPMVCIELEIPDRDVLLSDEEAWHFVLNNCYCEAATTAEESTIEQQWFESLSEQSKHLAKVESWDRIFDITPQQTDWIAHGRFVQATFWALKKEQIVRVQNFSKRK